MHSLSTTGPVDRQEQALDITFDSKGDRLVGLGLINGLLKILTLGIYSFWGKTEVRRRIWSFTRLNGEPLEYTGTGKELFLGFLVVFFLYILPLMLGGFAIIYVFPANKIALGLYYTISYVLFFLLIGNAFYRATRYRLSRTRWRGIRGGLTGSPGRYGWTYFWTLALPIVLALGAAALFGKPITEPTLSTLGSKGFGPSFDINNKWSIAAIVAGAVTVALILPWRSNALQRLMTNEMLFGNAPLTYTGEAGPLYKKYFIAGFGGCRTRAASPCRWRAGRPQKSSSR